jgi:hypothetical protein
MLEVITLEKAKEMAKKESLSNEERELLLRNLEFRKDVLRNTMEKIKLTKDISRFATLCKKFLLDYEDYLSFKEACWRAGIKF